VSNHQKSLNEFGVQQTFIYEQKKTYQAFSKNTTDSQRI
jgi:hypothetical protein